MAESQPVTIFCLPNEILLRALSTFRTHELLPLTCVSYRFHDLVLRLLHGRLLIAAEMSEHKLILECYHPASKNIEPYLFCDYLGTPGLSSDVAGAGLVYRSVENIGRLGKLAGLYSRFRPIRLEEEYRIFIPHPAGDAPGQRYERRLLPTRPPVGAASADTVAEESLVEHSISLDVDEPFSQLCIVANLVRLGPRRGVFFNFVSVSDGVMRVKRDWLAKRVEARQAGVIENDEDRTLWLDHDKSVGLKLKVEQRAWTRAAPILMLRDEDPAVAYKIKYEELLIRTTRLLLAVEEALLQDYSTGSGKAMIFGNFIRSD